MIQPLYQLRLEGLSAEWNSNKAHLCLDNDPEMRTLKSVRANVNAQKPKPRRRQTMDCYLVSVTTDTEATCFGWTHFEASIDCPKTLSDQ